MTTFYLQVPIKPEFVVGKLQDQEYISDELNSSCHLIGVIEADTWIQAKYLFSKIKAKTPSFNSNQPIELTKLQNAILEGDQKTINKLK